MVATTLSCRCRFCGYVICYSREDVGHDARCSGCGQTIRLPGKLAALSTIRRIRRKDRAGLALEIAGFLMMPFFFPAGLIIGAIVVYLGWKKSTGLVCSSCNAPAQSSRQTECVACRSKFGSE